jgi:hypothetical protein
MPIKKYAHDLDLLTVFALRNALLNPVSSDPSGLGAPQTGMLWFNTTAGRLKVWDGSAAVDFLDRSNHVGSQLASTISDLAATVQAYLLSDFAAPDTDVSMGGHGLTSLRDPAADQEAATKHYVDQALAGLASGQVIKGSVRVAVDSNVTLSAPGASLDSVALSNGDIALLVGQTDGTEDGPYTFNGAASPLTRAPNWDTDTEAALGSYWVVREGTYADNYALLTNDTAITLGTTSLTFQFIGASTYTGGDGVTITAGVVAVDVTAGGGVAVDGTGVHLDTTIAVRKVGGVIPTTSSGIFTVSGALVTINHGLNTPVPRVKLRAYTSPAAGYTQGEEVGVADPADDNNNVTITLPAAPAANNWYVEVEG